MYVDYVYALEEVERGLRCFFFAPKDGPRIQIIGLPGSAEFFDH